MHLLRGIVRCRRSCRVNLSSASCQRTNISLQRSLYGLAVAAPAVPGGHSGTCSLHFGGLRISKIGDRRSASGRPEILKWLLCWSVCGVYGLLVPSYELGGVAEMRSVIS